jgi:NTE family protein
MQDNAASPRFAYLIFEGGGAKGIAHFGALAAMESLQFTFAGVAGTSAGALVATLVAAGYRSRDLLDESSPTSNLIAAHGMTPIDLLGAGRWRSFRRLRRAAAWRLKLGAALAGVPGVVLLAPGALAGLLRFWLRRGLFGTEHVRDFVNARLRERLADLWSLRGDDPGGVADPVCFADLDYEKFPELRPLKIVATDVDAGKAVLFDRALTPNTVVADAVAASIAIPFFFRPVHVRERQLRAGGPAAYVAGTNRFADGGLVSNLPAWVFADEKLALERTLPDNQAVPIVAFSLADVDSGPIRRARQADGLADYAARVVRAGLFGGQHITRGFVRDLTVVPLPTALRVLDFDAPWPRWRDDYRRGRQAALSLVRRRLFVRPARCRELLRETRHGLAMLVDTARRRAGHAPLAHVRACVIEPFGLSAFRVAQGDNMEADADDRLPLDGRSARGAAAAFRTRDLHMAVLSPATSDFSTKYERALVRPGLRSAICVPIFAEDAVWDIADAAARPAPLGVLSVDSDEDLRWDAEQRDVRAFLIRQSVLFSFYFEELGA